MNAIRRIALVRLSALGDVTLIAALVRTLQKHLPDCEITWITSSAMHAFLQDLQGVEFIVIDKPAGIGDYLAFGRKMRARRFDVLLATQASLRINLLYPFIRADLKIGFDRRRARDGQWLFVRRRIRFHPRQHLLESFFAFLEPLGIDDKTIEWNIPIAAGERAWVQRAVGTGRPLLAVNPSASKAERNWKAERYAAVIQHAQTRWGAQVVLTGGPGSDEHALGERIQQRLKTPAGNLIGKTSPKQLAALLAHCDALLAPDTGPVHIAAALGTPVVGLYAVAPSWLSGPWGYQHLAVDRYDEAVRALLGRDPQTLAWVKRVHGKHRDAMTLIEVDDVLARLALIFNRKRTRAPAVP